MKKEEIDKMAAEFIKEKKMLNSDQYDPLITYIFINKNLDMSPGKVATQSARAAQVMLLKELKEHPGGRLEESLYELFEDEFMHGNKTITLKMNANQMNRLLNGDIGSKLKEASNVRLYPVYDVGANEVEPNSLTVIIMTPALKSEINHIVKKFQLY